MSSSSSSFGIEPLLKNQLAELLLHFTGSLNSSYSTQYAKYIAYFSPTFLINECPAIIANW